MKTWLALVALAIAGFELGNAQAGMIDGHTIVGAFDPNSIKVEGLIGNSPAVDQTTLIDNSGTAVFTVTPDRTTLNWGAPGSNAAIFSNGGKIKADGTTFKVGEITFVNRVSDITTLIFEATINFYDNTFDPNDLTVNRLASDKLKINTTVNIGDLNKDRDWLNICGENSEICKETIAPNAPPQYCVNTPCLSINPPENGMYTAEIMGRIIGDPELILEDLVPAPDQSDTGIGNDAPLTLQVPEPTSWTVLLIGVGFIITLHFARTPLKRRV
jgi:hypothetical protein